MSGLTLMVGAAVVGALATDKWRDVRSVVTGELPTESAWGDHGTWDHFVVETRRSIGTARQAGDRATEQRLADDWARRLQTLLVTVPDLDIKLRQVLYDVLLPVLPEQERLRVIRIAITAPRDQVISHNFLRSRDQIVR